VLRTVLLLVALGAAARLAGCMERLFYHPVAEPTPPPPEQPGAEMVRFASRDGTALCGWFIPARGAPAGSVLHVHGNAGNLLGHIFFSEHLPRAGYNLLIFDYRGYGESAGRPRHRAELIGDAHAALDALLARPEVDRERVAVYGHSLGGAIAIELMAKRPEIRAAVLESPFASWRDVAASAVGGARPGPVARTLARLLVSDSHRPLDAIAAIDRPILIVHGADDSIVPVTHGERLARAAPRATLAVIQGAAHNTLQETHPQVRRMMVEFLRSHLGGAGADTGTGTGTGTGDG
jgi:hypothetical protein